MARPKIRQADENLPQRLVFSVDEYGTSDEMWASIMKFIKILLDNRNLMTVKMEEYGIINIEYSYADESMGTPMPYWMTPDDAWSVDAEEGEEDDD